MTANSGLVAERGVRETSVLGETVERQSPVDEPVSLSAQDTGDEKQGDKVEKRKVMVKDVKTVKLQNVVPPIQFASGKADIPEKYVELLREALNKVKERTNVRLHFVGHTDNIPLQGAAKAMYGDNSELSRERAGTTAEYFQKALHLPPESISYEGMGDAKPVASNATAAGRTRNRRVEVEVWYDEVSEKEVEKEVIVSEEMKRVKVCRVETVCKLRYKEGHANRARIKNLIPPLHFDDATTGISPEFQQHLRQALMNLKDRKNVMVKFIGHSDNVPLSGRTERIYGNHLGLTKARARRAALATQDALGLKNSQIEVDGRGEKMPIASNDTEKGRALNRRIEVEFWYDDPLQQLPDEPQICPEAAGAETVTHMYEPESGALKPILFDQGKPVIDDEYIERVRALMGEMGGKANARLRFIGYTKNERLDRRTASVYRDDIGLSSARAVRAMKAVKEKLGLTDEQVESEGRGFIQAEDVVNTGFVNSDTSRVEVQLVYDDLAALDENGLELTRLTREVEMKDPFALNYMRISVDGQPIDDPHKGVADVQRCTDVALDKANIEFRFDNADLQPRLNVSAWPKAIRYQDREDTEYPENLMRFRMYSNYPGSIARAEVRLFEGDKSERGIPLKVVPVDANGFAEWQAQFDSYSAPGREVKYVLRVYDKNGNYDETQPQTLWVLDEQQVDIAVSDADKELLVGFGESRLAIENIPKEGGTVKVLGTGIPAGHQVWFAGRPVPVDPEGKFVAEEVLPRGLHTVELAVLDQSGSGDVFLRDLNLQKNDWFYVGIADLTASYDHTNGPAELVTNDQGHYDNDLAVDGRLAFFTRGTFANGWHLTSSADTLEGPVEDMFSNFLDKSPDALFRRIDPDYYYPTFGDDSTVEEGAPTQGKFYTKLEKDDNRLLWGNFRIGYHDADIAHVDRALYGANVHFQSQSATKFGEKRFMADAYGAEPGTVAAREEFLGTGGSLYYLRHQDILTGSERARIEVRDKDSNMILAVRNLTPGLDYDIDFIQGRIVLSEPLSTTTADNLLVTSDTTGGNLAYLVVRYEYTPGFDDINTVAAGGRSHVWLNDYIKFGVTANDESGAMPGLTAADLTLRASPETWLKFEGAETHGAANPELNSVDGGFSFNTMDGWGDSDLKANGYRVDSSIGFRDIFASADGRMTFYAQSLEAGYSAPGMITNTNTENFGGTIVTPITPRVNAKVKADAVQRDRGLNTRAGELDLDYAWDDNWTVSAGARHDQRDDESPVVPLTQVEGERTDMVARATYDSHANWVAYGFVQDTVSKTGNRDDNNRVGTGGSYRVTDSLKLTGEVSEGDFGLAGRAGTEYLYSDRTTAYLNYGLENERTDNGVRANKGSLVTGVRSRYSDSASVYLEEKYTHGDVPTGLIHSTGVNLAPYDHWTFGANIDIGTLRDHITGAKMERNAFGGRVGYGSDLLKVASALEYRTDKTEQPDLSTTERNTWLTKNNLKYQLNPSWRFIGKLNKSYSKSSLGEFYDGDYTEVVMGYGYRPVNNDRLNSLLKYTYFFNRPSIGQVTTADVAPTGVQRSHIFAIDTLYDLTPRWSVGGKYAYRLGEVSMDRENPQFFNSRAHLYILRADWHITSNWDTMIEGRMLDLPDAHDRRSGALLGVYRRVTDYVRIGGGYNFTDFSDDLTDLDYDSQGVFFNIVGKI